MSLAARIATSVRGKLLALVLLPLLVLLPALIAILIVWGGNAYDRLLIYKIRSDLAIADGYFERVKGRVGGDVEMLAESTGLALALAQRDDAAPRRFLVEARQARHLDFLHFVDRNGRVLASSGALAPGSALVTHEVVRAALSGQSTTVLDIFDAGALAAIDPALAARAAIDILPTRNAVPDSRNAETHGMIIHAASPVTDARGELLGALVGGQLLNRNLDFVDRINEIVYPEGSLPFGSKGTATLFLDDVRIATNVRLFQDEHSQDRAIGTRVSAEVRHAVLGRGDTWLDRAFVVNDWYVSAYEPLTDSAGRRVGMLYVGYLEAPFRAIKLWALAGVIGVFALVISLATIFSVRVARNIFRPLERMKDTMNAIEAGNASARVGAVASRDEIGQLAAHFDRLLESLRRQSAELRRWGEELDAKVAERTSALEASNRELRDTQRQLVMSKKLAAIGELTAGVAHEINNPVAVIQGNLDVLREVLGEAAAPVREELKLMDSQVERIRLMVAKLLQFARPTEFAGYVEDVVVPEVFADTLVLVGHLLKRGSIAVQQQITTTRRIRVNRNELQQVLINLMVNAIQAMPDGGTLTLIAADAEQDDRAGVCLSVRDSGYGIAPEIIDRVFDPFFTTKKQGGTGLGLSVSYGLVERYGGRITVTSQPGETTFTVWLPAA